MITAVMPTYGRWDVAVDRGRDARVAQRDPRQPPRGLLRLQRSPRLLLLRFEQVDLELLLPQLRLVERQYGIGALVRRFGLLDRLPRPGKAAAGVQQRTLALGFQVKSRDVGQESAMLSTA